MRTIRVNVVSVLLVVALYFCCLPLDVKATGVEHAYDVKYGTYAVLSTSEAHYYKWPVTSIESHLGTLPKHTILICYFSMVDDFGTRWTYVQEYMGKNNRDLTSRAGFIFTNSPLLFMEGEEADVLVEYKDQGISILDALESVGVSSHQEAPVPIPLGQGDAYLLEQAVLYDRPLQDAVEVSAVLNKGTSVIIRATFVVAVSDEREGTYCYVELPSGDMGFISASYVTLNYGTRLKYIFRSA